MKNSESWLFYSFICNVPFFLWLFSDIWLWSFYSLYRIYSLYWIGRFKWFSIESWTYCDIDLSKILWMILLVLKASNQLRFGLWVLSHLLWVIDPMSVMFWKPLLCCIWLSWKCITLLLFWKLGGILHHIFTFKAFDILPWVYYMHVLLSSKLRNFVSLFAELSNSCFPPRFTSKSAALKALLQFWGQRDSFFPLAFRCLGCHYHYHHRSAFCHRERQGEKKEEGKR